MSVIERDSFSHQVKEELKDIVGGSRHCKLAELSAIISFFGKIDISSGNPSLRLGTDHEYISDKFSKLIQEIFQVKLSGGAVLGKDTLRVLAALKVWNETEGKFSDFHRVNQVLLQKNCCRRAFIRGVFLAAGSMSDPEKSYHLEIVCQGEAQATQIRDMINSFGLDAKIINRKKNFVVYLKEGENLVDLLNIMGAHKALMVLENVRIMKEMRNSVNRQVNCETANIGKTVNAAVRQIAAITYIRDNGGLDALPGQLRQMAEVRLEHPDTPLKDLGNLLEPAIGKSGVNHRLRKLVEIAEEMGAELKEEH